MTLTPLGDSALLIITKYLEAVRKGWETESPDPLNTIQIQAENLHYLLSTDRQAIQRVRALHRPDGTKAYSHLKSEQWCGTCQDEGSMGEYGVPYPCATIRALDGEQA